MFLELVFIEVHPHYCTILLRSDPINKTVINCYSRRSYFIQTALESPTHRTGWTPDGPRMGPGWAPDRPRMGPRRPLVILHKSQQRHVLALRKSATRPPCPAQEAFLCPAKETRATSSSAASKGPASIRPQANAKTIRRHQSSGGDAAGV